MTREWCVIFNPAAGRRRARRRLQRWQRELEQIADFRPTERPGHARELARLAALEGFPCVGAAGGDGTVHEVLNGLMEAGQPNVRLGLLPIGSANDFAYSLEPRNPNLPPIRTIDVGHIRDAENSRQAYFGCCAGVGFNACVTVESRQLKHLQGVALYGVAAIRALVRDFHAPTMDVTIDDEPVWRTPTLLLSVLNGKREGNFPMSPQADLQDGRFNFVHAGALSRWQVLKLLPRLSISGPPAEYPHTRQGLCRSIELHSSTPLIAHIDGEFFCLREDNVSGLVIKVLPAALQIDLTIARTV